MKYIKLILLIIIVLGIFILIYNNKDQISTKSNKTVIEKKEDEVLKDKLIIKVNDYELTATLLDNSSCKALIEKLDEGDITINMHDYGNFEKVGELGFSLPVNDQDIKTEPGDLILYLGNNFSIYYDTNNWKLTRLGKIDDINQDELKNILGDNDITITLSIKH